MARVKIASKVLFQSEEVWGARKLSVKKGHKWEEHFWRNFAVEFFVIGKRHLALSCEDLLHKSLDLVLFIYSVFILNISTLILVVETLLSTHRELAHCYCHRFYFWPFNQAFFKRHIGENYSYIFFSDKAVTIEIIPTDSKIRYSYIILNENQTYILKVSFIFVSISLINTLTKELIKAPSLINPSLWVSNKLNNLSLIIPGN